jgi:hypothetical protein
MAYIPDIVDYKPFYIQKGEEGNAIDTTNWGLVAKGNPFPLLPTPKEPHKHSWLDENGDEEYTKEMYYEAFEFDVEFYIKTVGQDSESTLRTQMDSFFEFVKSGNLMIYDSYTGLGRKDVRYAGYKEGSFKRNMSGSNLWSRAIFTVTFKVNDPITRVVLSGNKLIEA